MSLERLVYCSRATFPAATERGLHPEVGRILMQSRRNNPRDELVGGLYFANGWFFQCLEGPAASIDRLLRRLAADPRHAQLAVLSRSPIAIRRFTRWSMKFVPDAAEVRVLLQRHGLDEFVPTRFDPATTASMVDLLVAGSEAPAPPTGNRAPAHAVQAPRAGWLLPATLATGVVALAVVAIAFLAK